MAQTPLVLMGYGQPDRAHGRRGVPPRAASAAGVDGGAGGRLPPEECEDFAAAMKAADIDPTLPCSVADLSTDAIAPSRGGEGGQRLPLLRLSLKGITAPAHIDVDAVARASR